MKYQRQVIDRIVQANTLLTSTKVVLMAQIAQKMADMVRFSHK